MNKKRLIEVLRLGILEIRMLSSHNNHDISRINKLANILHNIPKAIEVDKDFDFVLLKQELVSYKQLYKDGVDFMKLFGDGEN